MTSKVTATTTALATARRRRESSDDFAAGSLGSIGGSEVGSSVASNNSASHKQLESPASKPAAAETGTSTTITPKKQKPAMAVGATPTINNTTASKSADRTKKKRNDSNDSETTTAAEITTDASEAVAQKTAPTTTESETTIPPAEASSNNPAPPTTAATTSSVSSPPMSRRPFRKRKGSVDFTLSLDDIPDTPTGADSLIRGGGISLAVRSTVDALPSVDALDGIPAMDGGSLSSPLRPKSRSDSNSSSGFILGRRRSTSGASLERLDALGEEAKQAAAKIKGPANTPLRKGSTSEHSKASGHSSSHGTFTSQSHRMLLEAFMGGDGNESLVDSAAAEEADTHEFRREERLGSFDVRDRLGSFDVRERLGSFDALHDHRVETFGVRRERLESWGGMSDLSIPVPDTGTDSSLIEGTVGISTAALAASVYSSLANDLTAAANPDGNESISSFLVSDEKIPTRINMTRDRINSVNSTATDPSFSHLPTEDEIPSEIQQLVKAAMASVGDQLAEIAVAATEAAKDVEDQSEISSTASPMIGATSDSATRTGAWAQRPRSGSLTAMVDYDAVAAAINAAEAAAGAIDLAAFAQSASASVSSKESLTKSNAKRKRPQLPVKKASSSKKAKSAPTPSASKVPPVAASAKKPLHIELPPIPKSKLDERDMEIIRERARAAAGYVPPSQQTTGEKPQVPLKKRPKIENLSTPNVKSSVGYATPKTTNTANSHKTTASTPYSQAFSTPGSAKSAASKGQSSQKWDNMFECLIEFIEERKGEETFGQSDEDKKEWSWDGNVPTTFKTKDGKALGRWVNNQRSAKSKGVLKDDREKRLVDAGLKWSVLASNSWNEMLEELRVYVNDQTKAGRKWDGNVPTNYRIKTKPGVAIKEDEDKNLGRWVNRQRSLYQAGKLRKDRQLALEKVGLKWSMLATTSWDSMFDTLCEYVEQKTKDGSEWDGNVPANYRTSDNPPRALGRWINRQRSAYGKDKIKAEYVDKLNNIGLKWSVHERRPNGSSPDPVPSMVISDSTTSSASEPSPASSEPATSNDNKTSDDSGSTNAKEKADVNAPVDATETGEKDAEDKKPSEPPVAPASATKETPEIKEEQADDPPPDKPLSSDVEPEEKAKEVKDA